jgi:hypothetical protein
VKKIAQWLVFSVGLSMVPLLFTYLASLVSGTDLVYSDIVARGELFLILIALCGAGIGDMIVSRNSGGISGIVVGGLTVLILALSALLYAFINGSNSSTRLDREMIAYISTCFFVLGVISSACCVAYAEK